MKISAVYQIMCRVNGKRYIGSSVNVAERWGIHKSMLRHGKHINKKLQNVWNKYGEAEFIFEILEQVEPSKLFEAEASWLATEKPELNINPRPDAPMRGRKATAEHRAKISAGLLGRPVTEETRAKIAARNRGNKSALGCVRSEAFKERLRAAMTPELKLKLSRAAAEARERRRGV